MIQLIDPLPLNGADLSRGCLDFNSEVPATLKDSCYIGMACHGILAPDRTGACDVGAQWYPPAFDILGLEPDEYTSLNVGFGHGERIE